MTITKKEHFKDKNLKITYLTKENEISGDEGKYYDSDDVFIVLTMPNNLLKWIKINNIIRITQI